MTQEHAEYDSYQKNFSNNGVEEKHVHVFPYRILSTHDAFLFSAERKYIPGMPDIVGASKVMRELEREIYNITAFPWKMVLIYGKTGTGKELFARALHAFHVQKNKTPFMAINCAAIQDNLFESELFGHERGSFTDASYKRVGKFEAAGPGIILLDEIGDLTANGQAKLLRVLNGDPVHPVGGNREIHIQARIIAATNKNLAASVKTGSFREDLYYRLCEFTLELPLLEKRRDDIPMLAFHFAEECGENPDVLSEEIIQELTKRAWPGNVRELRNCVRRYIALGTLPSSDVVEYVPEENEWPLKKKMQEAEMYYIQQAIKKAGGNKTKAALLLGISREVLYYKIIKYNNSV